jgi:hypothetical protein
VSATRRGISRAQAYRLLDVARALAALHGAIAHRPVLSRMRHTDPATAAALDYGLSQRALIAVSGRSSDVAELITRRLSTLAHSGLTDLDTAMVRAVVRRPRPDADAAHALAPLWPHCARRSARGAAWPPAATP